MFAAIAAFLTPTDFGLKDISVTLRRAAFPHQVGSRFYDVYLLWIEQSDISLVGAAGVPRPVSAHEFDDLFPVIEHPSFLEAVAGFPPGAKVELVPSSLGRIYIRVLTRPVGIAARQNVIPLPATITDAVVADAPKSCASASSSAGAAAVAGTQK